MNAKTYGAVVILWALAGVPVPAAQPKAVLAPPVETVVAVQTGAGKDLPKPPDKDKPKPPDKGSELTQPPKTDVFQNPLMGSQFPTGFNPQMMGDFPGTFARRTFTVIGFQTTTVATSMILASNGDPPIFTLGPPVTNTSTIAVVQTRTILIPAATLGAFKVAENASPRPQDRVFASYNFYGGLRGASGVNDATTTTQTNTTIDDIGANVTLTSVSTSIPATPVVRANLHREVVGFEKTFFDGFASFELRVPGVQQQTTNVDGLDSSNIGDLTVIFKYALVLDDGGDVLSAGLAVTIPTGPSIATLDGNVHSTLLQPWFGYIRNFDRFYVQGFHSVVCPTDARDVTILFNDVGLNYWLYRGGPNRLIQSVVPTLEVHVTTPLNHRDGNGATFTPDLVVLTSGVHLGVFSNSTLTLGVAAPVTGPRLFGIEAFAQYNLRF